MTEKTNAIFVVCDVFNSLKTNCYTPTTFKRTDYDFDRLHEQFKSFLKKKNLFISHNKSFVVDYCFCFSVSNLLLSSFVSV